MLRDEQRLEMNLWSRSEGIADDSQSVLDFWRYAVIFAKCTEYFVDQRKPTFPFIHSPFTVLSDLLVFFVFILCILLLHIRSQPFLVRHLSH